MRALALGSGLRHLAPSGRAASAVQGRLLSCLLVEDETVIAIALEDELTQAGYEVLGPFATCAAALTVLHDRRPDAAVLDVVLQDGLCVELARELRRLVVPFLIYSGHNPRAELEFAGIPWIRKPTRFAHVVAAVENLIRDTGPISSI